MFLKKIFKLNYGVLLIIGAILVGLGVNDINSHYYAFATSEFIIGITMLVHLIVRYLFEQGGM